MILIAGDDAGSAAEACKAMALRDVVSFNPMCFSFCLKQLLYVDHMTEFVIHDHLNSLITFLYELLFE